MKMATEKIFVGIDSERVELTGAAKEAYLAQKELDLLEDERIAAKMQQKADARAALLERLGITAEEAKLLLS
jgi:hypothetical protein